MHSIDRKSDYRDTDRCQQVFRIRFEFANNFHHCLARKRLKYRANIREFRIIYYIVYAVVFCRRNIEVNDSRRNPKDNNIGISENFHT